MTRSTGKYLFITLPRMGTKHVQDQLVRTFGSRDHVEGHETFVYRGREFKMSLGEYFRNYGFAEGIVSNHYVRDGTLHEDRDRKFLAGLPPDCYAYQIAHDGRWFFEKRNYVNYYQLADSDFQEKYALLRDHGRSYVVKILFNQHTADQLDELLKLTDCVACYLKADILNWVCSYSLIGRYLHTDPQAVETTDLAMSNVGGSIETLRLMINYCTERGVPIVINRGDDIEMFGQSIRNFVTPEFSRFCYGNIFRNYALVAATVAANREILNMIGR